MEIFFKVKFEILLQQNSILLNFKSSKTLEKYESLSFYALQINAVFSLFQTQLKNYNFQEAFLTSQFEFYTALFFFSASLLSYLVIV